MAIITDTPSPLRNDSSTRWVLIIFLLALLAAVLQETYTTWLIAPADFVGALVWNSATLFGFGAIWCVAWAGLSRIFRKRWMFLEHCSVYLGIGAIYRTFTDIQVLAWFTFALPDVVNFDAWGPIVTTILMIYLHASLVRGGLSKLQKIGFVAVPLVIAMIAMWFFGREEAKNVSSTGLAARIYPPAFRLHSSMPMDDFLSGARQLKDKADKARDNLPPSDDET